MVSNWDPVGIIVRLAMVLGGLAIGAWGFARRDLPAVDNRAVQSGHIPSAPLLVTHCFWPGE